MFRYSIIIIIIIIIIIPCEFFPPVFAGGISLESEYQQISSDFQDSFVYSSRSKQCCCLDCLESSSDFKHTKPSFKTSRGRSKCAKYFLSASCSIAFSVFWQDLSTCLFFRFLWFSLRWDGKINYTANSLFPLIIFRSGLRSWIRWSVSILKSLRTLCVSFSRTASS